MPVRTRRLSSCWIAGCCAGLLLLAPTPLSASAGLAAARGQPLVVSVPLPGDSVKDDVRSVLRAADGSLLIGSNVLSAYDGAEWQRIDVPGAYGFRALAAGFDDSVNRVWVGAIGTIGYVQRERTGDWKYASLDRELTRIGIGDPGDVWGVCALGSGAVWVTADRIFRWMPHPTGGDSEGRFDHWHRPAKSHLVAFAGRNEVFVHQEGTGLLRIEQTGEPTLTHPESALPPGPVTWLLPHVTPSGDSLMGVGDQAHVLRADGSSQRLPALSDALQQAVPTCALALGSERIAIGTFSAGVVLAMADGTVLTKLSTDAGLPDRAVYSLHGHDRHVWAASPNGVSRIDAPAQATWFDRIRALGGGRPISAFNVGEREVVLTTTAVWEVSPSSSESSPVLAPVLTAPVAFSDAAEINGDTWVAGVGGLWQISDGRAEQQYFASADIVKLCGTVRLPNSVLFIEGYALKALMRSARGEWVPRDLGVILSDTAVTLLEDHDGNIWVSSMTDGIVCFEWDGALRLRPRAHYRAGVGLPAGAGRIELTRLGHRLLAVTEAGILELRSDRGAFVPVPELTSYRVTAITRAGTSFPLWMVQAPPLKETAVSSVMRPDLSTEGRIALTPLNLPGLDGLGSISGLGATASSSVAHYWVGGAKGLIRIRAEATATAAPPPVLLLSSQASDNSPGFSFSAPTADDLVLYQTRLVGIDSDWLAPTENTSRQFTGLAPGEYRFEVRAVDRFGRAGPTTGDSLVLLTPWWRTWSAIWGAAALVVCVIVGIARWRIARLRRHNKRLNELVAERTREIELSSTAKSDFLANVSHEIRNPLNGLTGLLALLKEERLDQREREIARSLKSVAGTLTQVFEEVLQFSKLEYGYGRLDLQAFALRPLLDEISDLFAAQAQQAGCSLRVVWPRDLADGFKGDREKIKTIVSNFVGNAVKYAPGAPVEVQVEATGENDGYVDLYIDVVDHGPGVPADEQELIFKKFVRGKHAKAGEIPGTGLGLATCRMLAKMMNGSVGVENRDSGGATFSLKLLLHREQPVAAQASRPEPDAILETRERLLIVDDGEYNRAVLEGIAIDIGAESESAATGSEAIARCREREYTAVLLDWDLPDGNGGDVAQKIRTHRLGNPIILATTGHDSDEIRQRCLAMGMDGFLLKPYDSSTVRLALRAARSARENGSPGSGFEMGSVASMALEHVDLRAFEHYARARGESRQAASDAYLEALRNQCTMIAACLTKGSTIEISRAAHGLRGLAGMIGATTLNHAAARLQNLADAGDASAYPAAWTAIEAASNELTATLLGTGSAASGPLNRK